jgi:hypothetical protein
MLVNIVVSSWIYTLFELHGYMGGCGRFRSLWNYYLCPTLWNVLRPMCLLYINFLVEAITPSITNFHGIYIYIYIYPLVISIDASPNNHII